MARSRFPDALALLTACVLVAAVLTWVLPAGEFERVEDASTARSVVVPGSYQEVEPSPVGPFAAMVAIPRGMVDAAEIIVLIFLLGGAFFVVDETGAIRTGIEGLIRLLRGRDALIVPISAVVFGIAGALNNMLEEFIALMPALVLLAGRVGFRPVIAVAMSAGASMVGASFGPVNPFQVGIGQRLAELPLLSGATFRTVVLALALALWIWSTTRYALANRTVVLPAAAGRGSHADARMHGPILWLVVATFAVMVWGLVTRQWGFNEMSGLFFAMGVVAGILGGLGVEGTATSYARGFRAMAYAALLVGVARAIFVVLEDGRIVDTLVQAAFTPVEGMPLALSAVGMMISHVAPGGSSGHVQTGGRVGLPVRGRPLRPDHPHPWLPAGHPGRRGGGL
jgi:uncharacterized ion transporter superfamily protein YfcC